MIQCKLFKPAVLYTWDRVLNGLFNCTVTIFRHYVILVILSTHDRLRALDSWKSTTGGAGHDLATFKFSPKFS